MTDNRLPSVFRAGIGGYTGDSFALEFDGDTLSYTPSGYGFEERASSVVVPTLDEWGAFRRTLDRIGTWNWDHRYEEVGVCDGTSWSVEIRWGDRELDSSGSNAYPPKFDGFLKAVRKLLGGLPFA